MKYLFSFSLLCIQLTLFSQVKNPVSWSFDTNQIGSDLHELIFIADFDEPWVVYSMHMDDNGPVPTSITYTSKNIEIKGDAVELGKKKEAMDPLFEVNVIKFLADEKYVIKQKVKITDMTKPVTGYVTFMTCDNNRCLPPEDVDFSFTYKTKPSINKGAND